MPNPILSYLRGDDLKAKDLAPETPRARIKAEEKLTYYPDMGVAIRAGMLVHGPGATQAIDDAWGQGRDGNSAVFACLMALAYAYIEPPLRVQRTTPDGQQSWLPDGPLQRLLDDPNPVHDALEIRFWTQFARHLDGNAYLRKVRSPAGTPVELWPISPAVMQPVTEKGSRDFISYYRYDYAPGHWLAIPPEDVVHFRIGIDDRDHRRGLSPVKRLLREIASDDQATLFADQLLRNFGIPGLVVQVPKDSNLNAEGAQALKTSISAAFGNDNRGNVGVLTGGADMKQFGFSPEQLNMEALHNVPETRIAAVMGVPPSVAGLGVGLAQTSNFASQKQVRENFTEVKLVPTWRMDAAKLNKHLKPEFTDDRSVQIAHDLSDVRALQEDEDKKYARLDTGVQGGWILPNEARADVGLPPMDGGDTPMLPAAPLALPAPGGKQRPALDLKSLPVDQYPDLAEALIRLATPAFEDDLLRFQDGQRRRAKRRLLRGA